MSVHAHGTIYLIYILHTHMGCKAASHIYLTSAASYFALLGLLRNMPAMSAAGKFKHIYVFQLLGLEIFQKL